MNLTKARVVLRPRTLAELSDLGWRFAGSPTVRRVFRRLSWWLLVPAWSLVVALRFGLDQPWDVVWSVAGVLAFGLEGAFSIAASRLMFEDDVSVGSVIGEFARRLPAYFVSLIFVGFIVALGAAFFWLVVPAIWALGTIVHVNEASLLERAGPIGAIGRSGRLVKGDLMRAFGLQLMLLLHIAAFVLVFEFVGNRGLVEFVLQLGAPTGRLEWGGSAFALGGLLAATPFVAAVRFLAYLDRRTRIDAWDVQVACMAVAVEHEREQEEEAA